MPEKLFHHGYKIPNSSIHRGYRKTKNPEKIAMAYTVDSEWRNRSQFINGRVDIIEFLKGKWETELDYKLKKSYWAHTDNRIAVRLEYEWRHKSGQWY